jgi:phosphate transport system substrate-binding protein
MINRWRPRWHLGVWFVVALAIIVGCQRTPQPDHPAEPSLTQPQSTMVLNGTGASFPLLFYERLFSEYRQSHPEVLVNYQPTGSAAGVQQLISKTVDFAASDVAMTDDEITQIESGVVMIPMTAGSVAVAYNLPGIDSGLQLSQTAFADIFLGEITQWNDPVIAESNPDLALPDLPITVVHRSDGSGTTAVLTAHLNAISPAWKETVGEGLNVSWPTGVGIKSNAGVSAQIQQAEGTVGYVEYSYAQKLGLAIAALENQAGNFVVPSSASAAVGLSEVEFPENLRAFVTDPQGAEAYPIVTYTWLLLYETYDDAAKATTIKDLVQWGLTDGQRFSAALGYVPLPDRVVEKATEALAKVKGKDL